MLNERLFKQHMVKCGSEEDEAEQQWKDMVNNDKTEVDSDGEEIARGLSNYSSADAKKLLGRASADIEAILGFGGEEELIHRDNLITTR